MAERTPERQRRYERELAWKAAMSDEQRAERAAAQATYDKKRREKFKAENSDWREIEARRRAASPSLETRRRYARDYVQAHKDERRDYQLQHRELALAATTRWRQRERERNPEGLRRKTQDWRLRATYGITLERYRSLYMAQGGVCAICRQPETMRIKGVLCALAVDHDRSCCPDRKSCGQCVRALLCVRCNMLIGGAKEDPAILHAAVDYLDDAKRRRTPLLWESVS